MRHRVRYRAFSAFVLLTLAALVGCGSATNAAHTSTQAATTTPTNPATPTAIPASTCTVGPTSWQQYRGVHFTICFPPDWTFESAFPGTGVTGLKLVLKWPNYPTEGSEIVIDEDYGSTDAEWTRICQNYPNISARMQLGNVLMQYYTSEGHYRDWGFLSARRFGYSLGVDDLQRSQETQAGDDAVLATFRLDDPTFGCPSGS